jgi:hypothetical protein
MDDGRSFHNYKFAEQGDQVRVKDIITKPDGTSQKFIILGKPKGSTVFVAYYVDFSGLRGRQCNLDIKHENDDDFELWNLLDERCLFGRHVQYYRRIEGKDCFIGKTVDQPNNVTTTCECTQQDYECEYNYYRDENGNCILHPGVLPLENKNCSGVEEIIWERTAYRKIPNSDCEGGDEPYKGKKVICSGHGLSAGSWLLIFALPLSGAGLVAFCWYRRKSQRFGAIRLPDSFTNGSSSFLVIVGSVISAVFNHLRDLADRVQLPTMSVMSNFSRTRYTPLNQDEPADLQLDDYEGVDGHFLDEEGDEDADEL